LQPVAGRAWRGLASLVGATLLAGTLGCAAADEPAPVVQPSASPSPVFLPGSYEPPPVPPERMKALVAYDSNRPLRVTSRTTTTERNSGVTITDLTFDNGLGGRVEAYLVMPVSTGGRKLAGVVFAHGSGRDRSRFLNEAKLLATRGAAVLLPTVPMNLMRDAADVSYVRQAVLAERRAVDVLVTRGDVDRNRLGFVGHSWGGVLAGIMSGAEPRLAAVVVASFTKRLTRYQGGPKEYFDQLTVFDQHRWLAMPGKRRVLLQAGANDRWHPSQATDQLFASIAGHKESKDYPLGHDLVEPAEPVNDRREFLARVLHLTGD
jgi:dipeptidyl aminopeptidase/acylaminoacyl peptidase